MTFELTILGSNSAIPAHGRHPSAQILNVNEKLYLIDCGEGTQMRFHDWGIRSAKIDHIFISHLHGDHYFGLIGLINSYHLLRREKPLHIYAHPQLEAIIDYQLNVFKSELSYPLVYHYLDNNSIDPVVILDNEDICVSTFGLQHSGPTNGFLFREKERERNMIKEKIEEYEIPFQDIPTIKRGGDWIDNKGNTIHNEELTTAPSPPRSYAYCSDTAYHEPLIEYIRGVDLLYHEATFLSKDQERAEVTRHSTTLQAATIAKKAQVGKLLIGHFSAKYADLKPCLTEAKTIFEPTELGLEGKVFGL